MYVIRCQSHSLLPGHDAYTCTHNTDTVNTAMEAVVYCLCISYFSHNHHNGMYSVLYFLYPPSLSSAIFLLYSFSVSSSFFLLCPLPSHLPLSSTTLCTSVFFGVSQHHYMLQKVSPNPRPVYVCVYVHMCACVCVRERENRASCS